MMVENHSWLVMNSFSRGQTLFPVPGCLGTRYFEGIKACRFTKNVQAQGFKLYFQGRVSRESKRVLWLAKVYALGCGDLSRKV